MNEDRTCPYCKGTACVLGNLGRIIYYRCQDCGIQFSVQPKKEKAKRATRNRRQAIQLKQNALNGANE